MTPQDIWPNGETMNAHVVNLYEVQRWDSDGQLWHELVWADDEEQARQVVWNDPLFPEHFDRFSIPLGSAADLPCQVLEVGTAVPEYAGFPRKAGMTACQRYGYATAEWEFCDGCGACSDGYGPDICDNCWLCEDCIADYGKAGGPCDNCQEVA